MQLPYVTEGDVLVALDIVSLVDAIEGALIAFSAGAVAQPVRAAVPLAAPDSFMLTMPARHRIAGVKVVTLAPGNAAAGLPTHHALILAFDATTGAPLAVIEGEAITRFRTAAASAIATRHLCDRPPSRLALIGSGAQAESHHLTLSALFDIEEISVWSPDPHRRAAFAERHGCVAAPSVAAAVDCADVVVTATLAREPVLCGRWLRRGAHVNAVGAPRPDWRELDDEAMANTIIVDSREAAALESGDVRGSGCIIAAELGEVAAGEVAVDVGRTTIFKSLGLAVEDVAAADWILRRLGIVPDDHR